MIIDYSFYINTYKGKVTDEDLFQRYLIQAEAKVDYLTFDRLYNLPEVPIKAKFAVCELIDLYENYYIQKTKRESSEARITSETVGSHSVSFKYSDEIFKEASPEELLKKSEYEIIAKYLMSSGLMYRGV